MAVAHEVPGRRSWLAQLLTTDFCPWANRFVYWLKEPVGWFVLATLVSLIVGGFVDPIGWTLAASLATVTVVGMVWPWIAVHAAICSLQSEADRVHEGDRCDLTLSVRNRLPLPLWGLAIEGYLDRGLPESEDRTPPTVALAYVPMWAVSRFRFSLQPSLRGRYPCTTTSLSCSFPFGIWTARRPIKRVAPVVVWPRVFAVSGQNTFSGRRMAEQGEGNRRGGRGDYFGIREYRCGDRVRQVNWIATARAGKLMITERGGPDCPRLEVHVDDSGGRSREEIADRIRVAASVIVNLHRSTTSFTVCVGRHRLRVQHDRDGVRPVLDALAEIPWEGNPGKPSLPPRSAAAFIVVSSDDDGNPTLLIHDPDSNPRMSATDRAGRIDRTQDLAPQLLAVWSEVRDGKLVA